MTNNTIMEMFMNTNDNGLLYIVSPHTAIK